MRKDNLIRYRRAALYIRKTIDSEGFLNMRPTLSIICGSGLSGLSQALTPGKNNKNTITIPYGSIPGFPNHCSVSGHIGEIVFGYLGVGGDNGDGIFTMCFRGRFHSYEGHDMSSVILPTRVSRCLGAKLLIVTNAVGALNEKYKAGDIVSVMDHIALPFLSGGLNPLIGPNDDELGPRFPSSSNIYKEKLQQVIIESAKKLGLKDIVHQSGTYCFVAGPMYESKSECQLLRNLGGDIVGMSTVPEIIAAHHSGMSVLCLSLVTNKVALPGVANAADITHEDVLQVVSKRSKQFIDLVKESVKLLKTSGMIEKLPDVRQVTLEEQSFSENSKFDEFWRTTLMTTNPATDDKDMKRKDRKGIHKNLLLSIFVECVSFFFKGGFITFAVGVLFGTIISKKAIPHV